MSFPARYTPQAEAEFAALLADPGLVGHAFLDRYSAWRAAYGRGGKPHDPRAIAVAAEVLAGYPRVTQATVRTLLGGTHAQARAAQQAICSALGQAVPLQQHVRLECAGSTIALLGWLRSEISALPETCLDAHAAELYPAPGDRCSARVLALVSPKVRLTAALHLLLVSADRMSGSRVTRRLLCWESLDRWATAVGAGEQLACPARVPGALLEWLRSDPSPNRLDFWHKLAETSGRLERYLRQQPAVAHCLSGRLVHVPPPREYHEARLVEQRVRAATKQRRSATADPLADNYREVLQLAQMRFNEVTQVREAFDAACAELDSGAAAAPLRFAVTLPRVALDGGPPSGNRTIEFEVHSGDRLADRYQPLASWPPHRTPARWLLVFRGVRDRQGDGDVVPIFEAYRVGLFLSPKWRTDSSERWLASFAKWVGKLPIATGLRLFHFRSGRDAELANRAFRDGLVLVPIDVVHHAFAVALAVSRTNLLSGARIGETLQQAHDRLQADEPDRLGAVGCTKNLPRQHYFCARPKGHLTLERFYVDPATVNALTRVVEVARRNGWELVPLVRPGHAEAGARPFLYQRDGCLLNGNQVNAALQALLFGYPLSSHDLRAAFGRFAGDQGIKTQEVQAALHHTEPAITEYYMTPTETMKAALARRLAERSE